MSSPQYDPNDVLFGSGIAPAQFKSPGDTYAGRITKLEAVQQRKFDRDNKPTNELDTWPDGSPKMMAVVTLLTDSRDPSDPSDDGQRKVYVASRDLQGKVRAAVKAAGRRKLDIGDYLRVTFTHEERTEHGVLAKVYEVSFRAADPGAEAANAALGGGQQPQQYAQGGYVAAQQPVAQVPTVQQMIPASQPVAPPPVVAQEPVAQPVAATAMNLDSLPPEARAMVEKMMAGQQQPVG